MLARESRFGMDQRHHVLQLVAKSVGTAALIKASAAPVAATQCLIQKPAVRHRIHRWIRCIDVDRAKSAVPEFMHADECAASRFRAAEPADERLDFAKGFAGAKSESDFAFLPIKELEDDLCCAAGIQTGACFPGKTRALHCGGLREISIAPKEFLTITGERAARLIQIEKGNAVAEFQVEGIAGQECSCLQVELRLNIEQSFLAKITQHPFAITGDRKPACNTRSITQFEDGEFYRRIDCHINPKFGGNPALKMLEHSIPKTMANNVRRCAARRSRLG